MSLLEDFGALIAVGAALVSALAALYARGQASAAKRANEIALHEARLQIFKGLAAFRAQVAAHGPSLKEAEVWKFSEISSLSEFYFPAKIASRLEHVFDDSLKLLTANDEWREARQSQPEDAPALVKPRFDLMIRLRDECASILNEMKPLLRVGDA